MVKYGNCMIKCNKCGKGCQVKTQIQRSAGWDYSIVTQSCSHGKMFIDMYTRNTYTPFGDPDEIKFNVKFIFAPDSGYTGTFERSFSRTSTEDGDDHDSKNCASAEAHFSGNGLGDYFINALGVGVADLVFAGDYYETRTFGTDCQSVTMDECLNEYIETAKDSLKLLEELVNDIKAHHVRCNVVKTAGTTVSVAGSALTIGCVIAAPFTGGASIVALTGAAMATATAGAITNLGTDVVDMIWTKKYHNELLEIDSRREPVAKRFFEYLDQIEAEAARIYKKNGNEEEALKEAFEVLITTGKISWKGKQVVGMAANMGRTTSSTLLRNGGKVWKSMRVNSNLLTSAFKKMGLDVSKRAAFNAVKGATVALSAIFIFWDLKSLADSLNNDHPAVEAVEAQIEQIKKQLKNLEDLRDSFNGEGDDK